MGDSNGRLLEGCAESGLTCRQRFNPIRYLYIHAQYADRLVRQPDKLSIAKNPESLPILRGYAKVLAKARYGLERAFRRQPDSLPVIGMHDRKPRGRRVDLARGIAINLRMPRGPAQFVRSRIPLPCQKLRRPECRRNILRIQREHTTPAIHHKTGAAKLPLSCDASR